MNQAILYGQLAQVLAERRPSRANHSSYVLPNFPVFSNDEEVLALPNINSHEVWMKNEGGSSAYDCLRRILSKMASDTT